MRKSIQSRRIPKIRKFTLIKPPYPKVGDVVTVEGVKHVVVSMSPTEVLPIRNTKRGLVLATHVAKGFSIRVKRLEEGNPHA